MINFEELYRKQYKKQVGVIRRALKNHTLDPEDIVQEAYSRAIRYQASYKPKRASVETWFNYIMFNVLREYIHKEKELNLEDYIDDSEALFLMMDTFYAHLREVPLEKHKSILMLSLILGYSSTEISQVLGVSVTNVTTVINRFRKELKGDGITI